jgi:RND superfamily putative drug exporter
MLLRERTSSPLVSRRGAWLTLLLALLLTAGVVGALRGAEAAHPATALPAGAESAQARELLAQFPDGDVAPVIAVFSRDGAPLSPADLAGATAAAERLGAAAHADTPQLVPSSDGAAAIVSVPLRADVPTAQTAATLDRLREAARADLPPGLDVQLTGGPAFGADIAAAFDGADFRLLAVTVAVVAVLLLLTYRSPVLWLVPLAVIGAAEQVASAVTGKLGELWSLQFDAGIISVLVFGAGTNYALLLISRYREELRRSADHRPALVRAVRGTAGAILASNVTVVLSLLTLLAAAMPGTRGIGVAAAVGLLIALAFALFVLPAALAVCGRRLFWPLIPRPGQPARDGGGFWFTVADHVRRRPVLVLAAAVAGVAVLAGGLLGTRVGLAQSERFRVQAESADGFAVLAEHFPPGEAAPLTVIADRAQADAVVDAATAAPGAVRATVTGEDGARVRIMLVGDAAPGTPGSDALVRNVRDAVHAVPGAHALVGGGAAEDLDVRDASARDLTLVAPLVLGVALAVLVVLLRALAGPVVLVVVNLASAVAGIGAGTWVGRTLFDFPALDVHVPLLAFLFLVALGIDYTIFLVHRARQEAAVHGTVEGMVQAVGHTGSVITSAGVVLAAVFAALGVLPLVTLGQLGLIVGLGVLLDTLVVRPVVVPAVFALLGDRVWWPGPAVRRPR